MTSRDTKYLLQLGTRISLIRRHPTSVSHGRGHWFEPHQASRGSEGITSIRLGISVVQFSELA